MLPQKKINSTPDCHTVPMMNTKIALYVLKVPLLLMLMVFGFMLDFFIQLPFHIMCKLDHVRGKRF
jgi:hypothetical protein